jgi:quinol monooxygenase YgiN
MSMLMVRYEAKPESAQENTELIRAMFAELAEHPPAGLRYAVFELEDGAGVVHLVCNETDAPHSPLSDMPAFKRYQEEIASRLAGPPAFENLQEVGSFRFWQ